MKEVNPFYRKIVENRLGYFRDKKIQDLTDEEIKEFMALRKELTKVLDEMTKPLTDSISEAAKLYQEMISRNSMR